MRSCFKREIRRRARIACWGLLATATIISCGLLPGSAFAAVLSVSATGSDTEGSGASTSPLRSVAAALTLAAAGDTVLVGPGAYDGVTDSTVRDLGVTVQAADPRNPPTLGKVRVTGGTGLTFRSLRMQTFSAGADTKRTRAAKDIRVLDSEISSPGEHCVVLRDGVANVLLQGNYVHDCSDGVGGPPTVARSTNIQLIGNKLENFSQNGIIFGSWDNVTVRGNEVGYIRDPTGAVHNDTFQMTGDSTHVVIQDNYFHDSAQLIFVQPAFGPISDVLIAGNVLRRSGAVGIQDHAVPGMKIVNNTVAETGLGGILVRARHDDAGRVIANGADTVVANNVVSATLTFKEVTPAVNRGNVSKVAGGLSTLGLGADLKPVAGAAVCGAGDPTFAPFADRDGVLFGPVPSIGAYACPGASARPASTSAAQVVSADVGCDMGLVGIRLLASLTSIMPAARVSVCARRHEIAAGMVRANEPVGIVVNLLPSRMTGFRGAGHGTRLSKLRRMFSHVTRVQSDVFTVKRKVFVIKNGRVRWAGVTLKPLKPGRRRISVAR